MCALKLGIFVYRDPVCGTFAVPMGSLATYFGIVFAVVTVFALAVMIVCYAHIFRVSVSIMKDDKIKL